MKLLKKHTTANIYHYSTIHPFGININTSTMKFAVASFFVASLAVASAFAPGNNAFARPSTSLNMAEPAEFVKTEIAAHDVSESILIKRTNMKLLPWDLRIEPCSYPLHLYLYHQVVVFSKSFCPFCKKTKELLEDLKIDATVYELNKMDDGADIQAALLDLSGQKTVPNVFIKGEHLGGNDDTQAAAKSGKLQEMLGI